MTSRKGARISDARGKFKLTLGGVEKAKSLAKEDAPPLAAQLDAVEKEFLAAAKVKLYASTDHKADFLASIASRRLDEHFLERCFAQDATVSNAVQRDPARHAQFLQPGGFVRVQRHLQDDVFGHALDAGGNVRVTLVFLRGAVRPLRRIAARVRPQRVKLRLAHARR